MHCSPVVSNKGSCAKCCHALAGHRVSPRLIGPQEGGGLVNSDHLAPSPTDKLPNTPTEILDCCPSNSLDQFSLLSQGHVDTKQLHNSTFWVSSPPQGHLKGHLFGYGGITVVKGTDFLRLDLMIRHI
jgi:hypothetical protein